MFSLREFIKKGLLDAVGKMADYQVILNAMGWYEKNVLLEEDLVEINAKIDEKNTPVEPIEPEIEEIPTEEETLENEPLNEEIQDTEEMTNNTQIEDTEE